MNQDPFQYKDGVLYVSEWEAVTAGFTTREQGVSTTPYASLNLGLHVEDRQEDVHENRRLLAHKLHFPMHTWICSEQTHANVVQKVTKQDCGKGIYEYKDGIAGTDGIYTNEPDVLLTSCYADCVPLYFYAPSYHLIGLAHAGWKGTVTEIACNMIHKWTQEEGVPLTDIHVAIGPSIGDCCYVVDNRVMDAVKKVVTYKPKQVENGQYQIDLKTINRLLCLKCGIPEENIIISSYCTSCEEKLFFSHRRDQGKTGRMMSFIGFREGISS
ncbi:peptidoglycan editing factor PgeF [Ectobacillus antri]|jgi:YfiH family protein|uniref:Purine nucleoside phosphorylase n=1 Tax=Ectobacillus antri TaxID=2486280 RepID=A0ABT6H046_9BACI|nr:peptidoglycan editing factor PgeF [Ectobacillus antri]MDG4655847.1 peptidoglycan editing factor PgeF [Ectobacillus antri]MDG5752522.1 peptidoglycan editing factor PgeF [Ectobacillus antri]